MTVTGDGAFREVMHVHHGDKGGAWLQFDWCPRKKRKRHQGRAPARMEVRPREKTAAWLGGSTESALIFDFQSPEPREINFVVVWVPRLWCFVLAALANYCTNSLYFPLLLKDGFSGYRLLGWWVFVFNPLNTSYYPPCLHDFWSKSDVILTFVSP